MDDALQDEPSVLIARFRCRERHESLQSSVISGYENLGSSRETHWFAVTVDFSCQQENILSIVVKVVDEPFHHVEGRYLTNGVVHRL